MIDLLHHALGNAAALVSAPLRRDPAIVINFFHKFEYTFFFKKFFLCSGFREKPPQTSP
jgi:hypothetical protein